MKFPFLLAFSFHPLALRKELGGGANFGILNGLAPARGNAHSGFIKMADLDRLLRYNGAGPTVDGGASKEFPRHPVRH